MKFMKNEEGFTGLEAAIVLIAFVVVAAVFSYVMLGAGFFTSQKSQEVVHTSVAQASSSIEVVGNVIGLNNTDNTPEQLDNIVFTIATTAGGSAFDINNMVLTYTDNATSYVVTKDTTSVKADGSVVAKAPAAKSWSVEKILNGNDNVLVEPGEQFLLNVTLDDAQTKAIVNNRFTLEMRPSIGASLQIKKTVPPQLDAVNLLY
jgi:flagellin FlaB